jgi:hypothetical protein
LTHRENPVTTNFALSHATCTAYVSDYCEKLRERAVVKKKEEEEAAAAAGQPQSLEEVRLTLFTTLFFVRQNTVQSPRYCMCVNARFNDDSQYVPCTQSDTPRE